MESQARRSALGEEPRVATGWNRLWIPVRIVGGCPLPFRFPVATLREVRHLCGGIDASVDYRSLRYFHPGKKKLAARTRPRRLIEKSGKSLRATAAMGIDVRKRATAGT